MNEDITVQNFAKKDNTLVDGLMNDAELDQLPTLSRDEDLRPGISKRQLIESHTLKSLPSNDIERALPKLKSEYVALQNVDENLEPSQTHVHGPKDNVDKGP